MELVDGEDLSRRIARGAIQLDEALPLSPSRSLKPSKPRTSRGSFLISHTVQLFLFYFDDLESHSHFVPGPEDT